MYILEAAKAEILENAVYGTVEVVIAGPIPGRVKAMGTSWPAHLCIKDTRCVLPPGTPITVVGRQGNSLLVLPYILSI